MELADWLKVIALAAIAFVAANVGGRIVAKIDDLRAELARGTANLGQVGTDLGEALDRIEEAIAAGDPTDEDIATARAIADGLAQHGAALDQVAGGGGGTPEEPPVDPPVEPGDPVNP